MRIVISAGRNDYYVCCVADDVKRAVLRVVSGKVVCIHATVRTYSPLKQVLVTLTGVAAAYHCKQEHMKTLTDVGIKSEVFERMSRLRPDSQRQWGKMAVNQMLCHLSDSFRGVMGEKALGRKDNALTRTVVKWIALKAPMKWPHGVKTMPEMDQNIGGTPPAEFEKDRLALEKLIERFTSQNRDFEWRPHPTFAYMSEWEWQRWGYLHVDHHFRQFGV